MLEEKIEQRKTYLLYFIIITNSFIDVASIFFDVEGNLNKIFYLLDLNVDKISLSVQLHLHYSS